MNKFETIEVGDTVEVSRNSNRRVIITRVSKAHFWSGNERFRKTDGLMIGVVSIRYPRRYALQHSIVKANKEKV